MAWRIADYIVRGEIDNRLPGIIKGTLYVEGLKEPLILELEGNCDPENAGLANHMGSAAPDWLKAMRRECVELRREIRTLTQEFEEPNRAPTLSSPSPVETDPPSA